MRRCTRSQVPTRTRSPLPHLAGNHEQRDLNERPFQNGGGFAWEIRQKYPRDERLIDLFQQFFMLMPIASKV